MKMVMAASIAYHHHCFKFGKPFNPVLGETYEAYLPDGTKLAMEQVSHHPPRTGYNVIGPNNLYFVHGYVEAKFVPGFNSARLSLQGYKQIDFVDGSSIRYGNFSDRFENAIIGNATQHQVAKLRFIDEVNGLVGHLNMEGVYGKVSDYFSGHIETSDGERLVDSINGTYMGYMNFDDERWFDLRE